ncbi:MAG: DUF5054 domain-containing protein [Planctomycetaceae bacterium]|jgi:hypothetical protein|nr:DUF5054 domain-containing protein [Planctomycetaceae bacterium]
MKKNLLTVLIAAILTGTAVSAFADDGANEQIEKVHVIFKTHLDVGFTDLAVNVEKRYIDNFIPKAIALNEQLRQEGSADRYVWTTGSWLIDAYLKQAKPDAVKKLDEAIQRGDIVWNGVPYTFQSEVASYDIFETTLKLAERLDKKYGKQTVAAKMTDVPGHTRNIITPLCNQGIRFLHIGVNDGNMIPKVPKLCRWKNVDGNEIILMIDGEYGGDSVLPDGKTVISINFTSDNVGPHSLQQVKSIFDNLRKKYPKAEVVGSNLNETAKDAWKIADKLPVVTAEIGDTWIYGAANHPEMIMRYRTLARLFSQWLKDGKLDKDSDVAIDFAVYLGFVAEHTWGIHAGTFWNVREYSPEKFDAVRTLPEFRRAELSWKEKAGRVDEAVALLPPELQREAKTELERLASRQHGIATGNDFKPIKNTPSGNAAVLPDVFGTVAYQAYSQADYERYFKLYLRPKPVNPAYGKPGLKETNQQSATLVAQPNKTLGKKQNGQTVLDRFLSFPNNPNVNPLVLPYEVKTRCVLSNGKNEAEIIVSIVNKPAVRLPEAYWFSFFPKDVEKILVEKMGQPIDVTDIVDGGSRQMHAVDRYVDVICRQGTVRITSLDVPLVTVGSRDIFDYPADKPDLNGGIHFCLFNNLWGTNYAAWLDGTWTFRFKMEWKEKK